LNRKKYFESNQVDSNVPSWCWGYTTLAAMLEWWGWNDELVQSNQLVYAYI
jgi:hypothetical protein